MPASPEATKVRLGVSTRIRRTKGFEFIQERKPYEWTWQGLRMIYMVEHTFGVAAMEDDWNAWYAGNVANLLTVPGFETAQRFKIFGASPPRYMAMYNVTSAAVFNRTEYKNVGGGGIASKRFRPAYTQWRRSLFEARDPAPAVMQEQALVVSDRAARGIGPFSWLTSLGRQENWITMDGLQETPPFRGLLVVPAIDAARFSVADGAVDVYSPITVQLTPTKSQQF